MKHDRIRLAALIACCTAAWQPSNARAADEDTQFWLNEIVTGDIAEGTTLTVDATQRFREDRDGDQQTLRFTLEKEVARDLDLGGGIGVFETGGLTEIRVTQQATFTPGRFALRTRLEERFFDGADRAELRFRQRVHYNHPIAEKWEGTVGVEWLALVQPRDADRGPQTDQWRFQAILSHEISDSIEVGAIYWLVVSPRGERVDRINHIPQAVLTWRF
ncbi:MAG: DUF2490 domain-containing protein [Erythrobacter sp.]|jgi:hypothetical protein|nr:DUF2490 domain-containing protein [Erythrobacter sp.]